MNELKPVALCLQETFLKDTDQFTLKYHSCYFKNCIDNNKASGGVAVVVNNSIPHHVFRLDTTLQAVAVNISLNKTITLCSIYLPPCLPIDVKKLDQLVDQLSPSRTGGRIRRLPSCRVVKPHQWTRLFAVGGDS